MLLIVEKPIRGRLCQLLIDMKDYDKSKESSQIKYWDVNNFYEWAMSKKLSVGGFK